MDLRLLRYYIAVAEELNFTRAAERLHTAQPSLSAQIRRLEDMVGTRLLERSSHHVELTAAGRTFLEEARKTLEGMDRAIERTLRSASSGGEGISIGFVSGLEEIIVPNIMAQMQRQYPETEFRLVSSTDTELLTSLRRKMLDIVFCAPLEDPEVDAELASEVVFRMELVAIYPSFYEFPPMERIPVSMLASKPFIGPMPKKYPFHEKTIRRIEAQSGVRFQIGNYADGALATVNAVDSGLGFGFVPDFMTRKLPPSITARPLDLSDLPQSPIVAVYRRSDDKPAVRLFLSFLRQYVKEHEVEVSTLKKAASS
jgi:LysR family transcriptional regulator, hca operon transcriptional activator